jgi:type I restriction enzyme M protein
MTVSHRNVDSASRTVLYTQRLSMPSPIIAMSRLSSYYDIPPAEWLFPAGFKRGRRTADTREPVRQWLLKELFSVYGYPQEWLDERIIFYHPKGEEEIFGFSFLTKNKLPFLMALVTMPRDAPDEREIKNALLNQNTAGLGIITNGSKEGTRFMRRRFNSEGCDYITDCEPYSPLISSAEKQLKFIGPVKDTSPKSGGRRLSLLTERVENVFFEVHSHIRDIDGLHADEALDELCKVLYLKLYDEEATESNKPFAAQRWEYGSTEEFAATVRGIYQEAGEYDSRVFGLKIPGYQRSRGVFNKSIRLSSPALVKALETLQEYNITCSDLDVKGRAFQKVLAPAVRAGMGQYFTPDPVVRFMGRVARPSLSDLILDPFCGSAHFLTICLRLVQEQGQKKSGRSFHEFAFGKLHGIEKSDRMVRIAMTDMRLHGDGHSNIRCTDALLNFYNYPDIHPESFDLILTNPPFGSLLGSEAQGQLGDFELTRGRKTVPLEVLGLERSVQFLRPGGRLGIVLPDGIIANRNTRYVREWLESQCKLRAIISLPVETFSPFGANIKTNIIFARKWQKGESKKDYPIFLARIDNVGYDAAGRKRELPELDEVADKAIAFIDREGW